jgi:hypothetical protein
MLAVAFALLGVLSVVPVFTEDDALSGIFMVMLGSPWTQLLLAALGSPASGGLAAGLVLGVAGISVNTALVYFVSRWLIRRLTR